MNEDIERLFYLSASALTKEEHEKYMKEISEINNEVFNYLIKIEKNKWAIS